MEGLKLTPGMSVVEDLVDMCFCCVQSEQSPFSLYSPLFYKSANSQYVIRKFTEFRILNNSVSGLRGSLFYQVIKLV